MRKAFLIIFIIIAAIRVEFAHAEVKIILRPEVEISSQRMRLEDIADIQAENKDLARELGAIELGEIYTSGKPRIITVLHVKSRIALKRLNSSAYTFIGSKSIVRYRELTISPEKILEEVRKFYLNSLMTVGAVLEPPLQVKPRIPIRPIPIPDESAELRFLPLNDDLWKGSLEVQAVHRGHIVSRQILAFELSTLCPMVVAAQEIPRGVVIKPEHLKLEQRWIEHPNRPPFTKLEEVVGKTSKTFIREGEMIESVHLEKSYLILKGSIVTIVAQRGHLRVEAKARALDSGERGQRIRLMNLASKKEITGEVIGDGQVRVHF